MRYKGYTARVEFDAEDEVLVGHILGIADVISFHGKSVDELAAAFRAAVDHYIADCEATGRAPLRPSSGKIALRITPEAHAQAAIAAEAQGKSLNQWLSDAIAAAAAGGPMPPGFAVTRRVATRRPAAAKTDRMRAKASSTRKRSLRAG